MTTHSTKPLRNNIPPTLHVPKQLRKENKTCIEENIKVACKCKLQFKAAKEHTKKIVQEGKYKEKPWNDDQ